MKNCVIAGAFAALALISLQAQAGCNKSGTYIAASGDEVVSPRCVASDPGGAKYRCQDGSLSHAEHRQGACSRHGGVAETLN